MIKGLKQVAAYLDDVIVFDFDPVAHVRTILSSFELLKHSITLSPSKARLGAPDANFLGHSISPGGLRPNAEKVSALTNMSMPTDVNQVCALMGGINYYRHVLPALSKRLHPINALLRQGVKVAFTSGLEKLVREILAELTTPPVLVFPDWDAAVDGTRPFYVYCDACVDGFGAAFEQEQTDGFINPSRTSAELRSTRKGIGLLSIWRLAASSGLSSASKATLGTPSSEYSQTTRLWKA